jgi:multidrug efflux pump subunit AcrA (membrane-fusion protein)
MSATPQPLPERPTPDDDQHPHASDAGARRPRSRSLILIGLGLVVLFSVLLAIGAIPRVRNQRELAAAAARTQSSVPEVYVVRPQRASETSLSLPGTTQAMQDSIIYARTSGYLARRLVDIGDRVSAGQVLAEIASPEVDQTLRQAQADLQQSEKNLELQKANLELARTTMARYQAADAEGAVAKQAVDQSVATHQTAKAAVAAADANVQSNRANVQRLQAMTGFQHVVAPFDGTVIQRNVDVGALITAGSPVNNIAVAPSTVTGAANGLFEVAQIDTLRVFVNVPQAYAPNVRAALPVQIRVRGHIEEPVSAKVTRTATAMDPGTRTLLTQVDIPNASHRLLPGMFVYVDFSIGPSGTRWRVPATAMIFDAQGTRVVIVGPGNKLHFQPVVVGRDLGESIDIQSGLRGDESVVAQPRVSLQEGQTVTPMQARTGSRG